MHTCMYTRGYNKYHIFKEPNQFLRLQEFSSTKTQGPRSAHALLEVAPRLVTLG